MVMMHKPKETEKVDDAPKVDCRECKNYPNPNTTGKSEDLLVKTNRWTRSFCGTGECEDKKFVSRDSKDSVDKGATDGEEQKKNDTDDVKSEK